MAIFPVSGRPCRLSPANQSTDYQIGVSSGQLSCNERQFCPDRIETSASISRPTFHQYSGASLISAAAPTILSGAQRLRRNERGVGRERRESDRRRMSDRLAGPFGTLMRLRQSFGVKRKVAAVVENLSGDGAFARTGNDQSGRAGVPGVPAIGDGIHVAARGLVVRSERESNGNVGIAVQLRSHRFCDTAGSPALAGRRRRFRETRAVL